MNSAGRSYFEHKITSDGGLFDLSLPTDWGYLALKRMLSFGNGKDHKNIEVHEGGFPVYGSGGSFARASQYLHDGESVLFGRKGTVDRPLYLNCRFWTVDTMYFTRIRKDVCARYIYYAALGIPYGLYSTNTALPSMTQEVLGNHKIPSPPLEEQTQIAKFLDYETAKIDALIEKQQQLIALLKEKRRAVISHAVTKGLNPDAPMRDSGVEWLGEVPAHWKVLILRRLTLDHRQGYYTTSGYVDDGGTKLLRITDLREFGKISFEDCPKVSKQDPVLRDFLLMNGDFVFARTGGAGSFGLVGDLNEEVAYASYLIRFRFDGKKIHSNFLKFYLLSNSFLSAVTRNIHGGVNQNIHAEDIKNTKIALPGCEEQVEIAKYLHDLCSKMDKVVETAEDQVKLLDERRTALISAAVTGKIDVRRWKPPKSEPETEVE